MTIPPKKTRGAQSNPDARFESLQYEAFHDGWYQDEMEMSSPLKTEYFEEKSKSIISRNDSPDLGFEQSINPYQGCEHGCVYCYARPTHAYKNLSSGLDFESKIFYKKNAAQLLEKELAKKNYVCKPIVLGANTDPYQPIENKLNITQAILKVLQAYQHPVIIITKGALIERDLDLLQEMAQKNLVRVTLTITTLSASLKRILEPRAALGQVRLRILQKLSERNIPRNVMIAPVIPFINDGELEKILQAVQQHGGTHANYVFLRLPHEVKDLFREWLALHFPQRAQHVMSIIQNMRNGKDYDASFGTRMRGTGEYAQLLKTRFQLGCQKYHLNQTPQASLDTQQFYVPSHDNLRQLSLFEE